MRIRIAPMGAALLLLAAAPSQAISLGPLGANGAGGQLNGQSFTIGAGGAVFELDSFVSISGADLNGGASGTSARLSSDPLPPGLGFSHSASLLDGDTDILLSYEITNATGADVQGLTFYSFLDAEIDEPSTTFFNEFAATSGLLAPGQSFEVDEPGYVSGDIVKHLLAGALDGTNALPAGSPDDVSMALGFAVGAIPSGGKARFDFLISEDGDSIGSFSITQRDSDPGATTAITYSGRASVSSPAVPEPTGALLYATGFGVVATYLRGRRRTR